MNDFIKFKLKFTYDDYADTKFDKSDVRCFRCGKLTNELYFYYDKENTHQGVSVCPECHKKLGDTYMTDFVYHLSREWFSKKPTIRKYSTICNLCKKPSGNAYIYREPNSLSTDPTISIGALHLYVCEKCSEKINDLEVHNED
jgi:thymidine kinase